MAAKRRWFVTSTITISVHTEVMATSKAKAIAEAHDRPVMSLCHQCTRGEPEQEWVTSGDLDGEPHENETTAELDSEAREP